MKRINNPVFIEYETKNREFDSKLLLIAQLLNKGFSKIYIGAAIPIRKEALLFTNGIYIFKSVLKSEESLYMKLKERGFILVLIHAEGGIYYKDNVSSIESSFNNDLMKYFDYNFVYGTRIKEDIEKINGPLQHAKIIVSGEPRFDMLKSEYISYFETDLNNLRLKYNKFILINTNFSLANPHEGYVDLKQNFLNNPTFSSKAKELYLLKIFFFPKVVEEFVKAINRLASTYPNINFVVRPHPSESEVFYKKQFKGMKNVIITKKENVANWILASLGVIHYDCTTGIEALLARKPVISYIPIKDNRVVAWLPIESSKKVASLDSLIKEIEELLNNKFSNNPDSTTKKILEETINNFITDSAPIISKNLTIGAFHLGISLKNNIFSNTLFYFDYNLKTIVKRFIRRDDISASKFGRISKKEVTSKILQLQTIKKFNNKFKVKNHTLNSVIIYNTPQKPDHLRSK